MTDSPTPASDPNSVAYLDRQLGAMETEFSSFIPHYKDLADFIQPRKGRFFTQDRNKGDRRYNNIINSVATQSLRTAQAGLLSGVASPSRPWFSSETVEADLMEFAPVKIFLDQLDKLFRSILNQSNFYNMTPVMFAELLLFGTGAMSHVDDFKDVARFYTHTAGSYMIGQNDRYEIDRFARKFEMTVSQIVDQFGLDNVSTAVKASYDRGDYHQWIKVNQLIEPNPNFTNDNDLSEFKQFRSTYWEGGSSNSDNRAAKVLSRKGFDEFPVYVPRWSVTGEDIYGTDSPAMTALGDIKGLQIEERRKAQAIDKLVSPPLHGPATVRQVPVQSLAGGLTIYDAGGNNELKPIYQVDPRLNEMRADMAAIESRIEKAFYNDLFLAISNMEGVQPRNQLELTQRNQERLLQLGPVLERLQSEFLDQMLNRLFSQVQRAELLPDIPEELEGQDLKVKYVSSLAMAQRAVATAPIERTAAFVAGLAELYPDVTDKFDADQAVDEHSRLNGTIPTIIVSDDQVADIREARAQAMAKQQAQQEAAANQQLLKTGSETAKNIAATGEDALEEFAADTQG